MSKKLQQPSTSEAAAARLVQIISDAGWQVGLRSAESFRRFVAFAVARAAACGGDSAAQSAALAAGYGQQISAADFLPAYDLICEWAERSFEDVLGPAYMLVSSKDGNGLGQFFTPYHISLVTARLLVGDHPQLDHQHMPLTPIDPCVGSGGLLLAAASLYPREWHERGYVVFYGIDLDPVCVQMAHLNMRLHRLCSKIACGNSLTDNIDWDKALTNEPVAWPYVSEGQLRAIAAGGELARARQLHRLSEEMRIDGCQPRERAA